jgi:pheromone shutdown-related protein TraB
MQENVYKLNYEDKELILIATAHVSHESVDLVKQVIESEQPDSVCVELDEGRFESVMNPKKWRETDIVKIIKSKKVVAMLANLALSSYQKKIAKKLNIQVGREMIQGIESAKENGAELILADRNIQTTFMRIWRKLTFFEKIKLFFSFFLSFDKEEASLTEEDLQNMLKDDILESLLKDLRKQFPTIGEVLLSERDQYLAAKIKEAPGKKIVAVLGGAHVPGVKEEIYKTQDLDRITHIPPAPKWTKAIGWAIPIAIVAIIIYSFFQSMQTGIEQISAWVLWNGAFSALFTALALGHPLSILTAFVVAPISSLNPLMAAGWFAGLVEATLRKPTVDDVGKVPEDFYSFKGFFKNRFLRILLVVIMANIGSMIGTFIAGLDIIKNVF